MNSKYDYIHSLVSHVSQKLHFNSNKNYLKQIYHFNGVWTMSIQSFGENKVKENLQVIISPKKREIWIGNTEKREKLPISLCKQIRNNTDTKKKSFINYIKVVNEDRTVVFSLGDEEFRKFIVFELYADGNLCLVDKDNVVIGLTRKHIDNIGNQKDTTKVGCKYRLDLYDDEIYAPYKEEVFDEITFSKKIEQEKHVSKKKKPEKLNNALSHQIKNKESLESKSEFFRETAENMELSMCQKNPKNIDYQKIQEWYQKKKLVDKKLEGAKSQIEKQEKIIGKNIPKNVQKNTVYRNEYYHEYIWFYTTKGNLVIGGKNSSQNEKIVKKYMIKGTRYFHCELGGSGSFLWIPSSSDEKGDDKEMREVADAVLTYSTHRSGRVYWINPFNDTSGKQQVSKTAPSGLSLGGKGSFMVTGKGEKNYVPTVSFDFGIVEINRDSKGAEIMVAPYRVVKEIKGPKIKLFDNGEQLNRKKINKIIKNTLFTKNVDNIHYPNLGGTTVVKK